MDFFFFFSPPAFLGALADFLEGVLAIFIESARGRQREWSASSEGAFGVCDERAEDGGASAKVEKHAVSDQSVDRLAVEAAAARCAAAACVCVASAAPRKCEPRPRF